MRYRLRLTARDLDLIVIAQVPGFQFSKIIKASLKEYVMTGKCTKQSLYSLSPSTTIVLKSMTVSISLDENEDAKVIEWISTLRKGAVSAAIKSVLRQALVIPMWIYEEGVMLLTEDPLVVPTEENRAARKPQKKELPATPPAATSVPPVTDSDTSDPSDDTSEILPDEMDAYDALFDGKFVEEF